MVNQEVMNDVIKILTQIISENGLSGEALLPDTKILQDTGLDSLALAEVVIRLEEHFGKDPFADGFINFVTISDLAKLYG